jgi:hypothetical protein
MSRFCVLALVGGVGWVGCNGSTIGDRESALGATALCISQVYGGGGNSGSFVKNDYVELFNRGAAAVSLDQKSIQYHSDNGSEAWQSLTLRSVTLDPGQYYLIQLASGTNPTPSPLPIGADQTGTLALAASAGKVALVAATTPLSGCGVTCAQAPEVLDFVGYGASANDHEGPSPAPPLSNAAKVEVRKQHGCQDGDDNRNDFLVGSWSAGPSGVTLHNSASSPEPCVDESPDLASAPDLVALPDLADAPDLSPSPPALGGAKQVVISQIYGGGGNSAATYQNDFVELFNRGPAAVDVSGWSVQYGSAANNFSQKAELPSGTTLAAGSYLLVELSGGSTGAPLPAPDVAASPSFNLSATGGKLALVANHTILGCGGSTRCSSAVIIDLVGYGSSSDFEGHAAAATALGDNAKSLFRKGEGCVDSDDNAADFEVATAAARNQGSATVDCSALPAPSDLSTVAIFVDLAQAPPPDLARPRDLLAIEDLAEPTVVLAPPDLSPRRFAPVENGCALGGRPAGSPLAILIVLLLIRAACRASRPSRASSAREDRGATR